MSRRARRRRDDRSEPTPAAGRWTPLRVGLGASAALAVVALVAVVGLGWPGASAGPDAPDFAMVAYQGEEVLGGERSSFHDLFDRGRPVVLNFWASSCPPCREEMPGFQRVHDDLGDGYTMVGVDIGPFVRLGTHDGARDFLSEYGIAYPAAYATDAEVVRDFEVRGMPTTLFFDADGALVEKHTGFLPEGQLRREIEGLLAAAP